MTPDSAPDSFEPAPDSWNTFHRTTWERTHAVLARPLPRPLCTPAELFDTVVAASDRVRAGDESVRLFLYVEQAQLVADVGRHLPTREDGSSAGWADRVTRLFGGRTFGLVLEHAQAHHPALWSRLRDALGGLLARVGLPTESKATIFLGNYPATPFGLHRGNSGTLSFVIEGPKRVRIWPDAFMRERPQVAGSVDYHAFDADSTLLDGDAGDVLYWPSDAWHIGEAVEGRLSSAVSVHLFTARDPEEALLARARPLLRRRLAALPPDASDAALIDALADTAASPSLARDLRIARLRHASALGFTQVPEPLPVRALGDDDRVRSSPHAPIRWADVDAERLAVAAGGHAFGLTRSRLTLALLERLNSAEPLRVGDLLAAYAGVSDHVETTEDAVRAVLERLVSLRGLQSS